MRTQEAIAAVLRDYPRIFFACHRRHTRDPRTKAVVSERQAQILEHLDEIQAISLTALAEHLGVTLGTMSIAIDRLVALRLAKRTADPLDARRTQLRLTSAGARICRAHSVLDPARVESLVAALGADERVRAIEGLALLAKGAELASAKRSARSVRRVA